MGFCWLSWGTASDELLPVTWEGYKQGYIQADGRVIDPGGGQISTSEGQAYALVRAMWMDDPVAFSTVLEWTLNNLQGGDPARLPAWRWGPREDGTWGVLDPMPASDADEWLAWALLGAADRWSRPDYRDRALWLLERLWEEETLVVGGRRVLLPGPWAKTTVPIRLNPSYWLPFAWRRFAAADPAHDWASLIDPAYELWETCRSPSGLPPDWCSVDPATGAVVDAAAPADANFGFEAFRVGWTLAAEWRWHGDPRAASLLEGFTRLQDRWRADGRIPAVIAPDGSARAAWAYPGLYGALLPAWSIRRPLRARSLYVHELEPIRDAFGWGEKKDYYGQNWIWFGLALWSGVAVPA